MSGGPRSSNCTSRLTQCDRRNTLANANAVRDWRIYVDRQQLIGVRGAHAIMRWTGSRRDRLCAGFYQERSYAQVFLGRRSDRQGLLRDKTRPSRIPLGSDYRRACHRPYSNRSEAAILCQVEAPTRALDDLDDGESRRHQREFVQPQGSPSLCTPGRSFDRPHLRPDGSRASGARRASQPHRVQQFNDPQTGKRLVFSPTISLDAVIIDKLRDVVGLCLMIDPPAHAIVLSVDEKSQIQALDRTQPGLPMKKGRAGTMTLDSQIELTEKRDDYKRHGTTTLFAALDILEGKVIGRCMQRHRHQEFIRFLNAIEAQVPARKIVRARDPRQLRRRATSIQRLAKLVGTATRASPSERVKDEGPVLHPRPPAGGGSVNAVERGSSPLAKRYDTRCLCDVSD